MPPDSTPTEGSWAFRSFLLFVGLLICAFIGWLVWAMVEFSPTVEKDIARSLLSTPLFEQGDMVVTNQSSQCQSSSDVKGNIPASLLEAFRSANQESLGKLELHRFQKERRIVDASRSPDRWYLELKKPVMSISNPGIVNNQALVCLELYAQSSRGMFVVLEFAGADYWRLVRTELAWQEQTTPFREEVPELTLPVVE